jgi:hypothetical protein
LERRNAPGENVPTVGLVNPKLDTLAKLRVVPPASVTVVPRGITAKEPVPSTVGENVSRLLPRPNDVAEPRFPAELLLVTDAVTESEPVMGVAKAAPLRAKPRTEAAAVITNVRLTVRIARLLMTPSASVTPLKTLLGKNRANFGVARILR